jgi:hypothetical protein
MVQFSPHGLATTSAITEFPYEALTLSQITRFLNDGGASAEAKGAVRESIRRLNERMAPFLVARVSWCIKSISDLRLVWPWGDEMPSCYLEKATMAALLVGTVGSGAEEECNRLYRAGEYIDALVLDAMASAALARGIQKTKETVRKSVANTITGYTLYPGGQHMPFTFQRVIFDALRPEETLGVKLTESMLMVPVKSASAIIPMGEALSYPEKKGDACAICPKKETCDFNLASGETEQSTAEWRSDEG